jgi:hypothetical protein
MVDRTAFSASSSRVAIHRTNVPWLRASVAVARSSAARSVRTSPRSCPCDRRAVRCSFQASREAPICSRKASEPTATSVERLPAEASPAVAGPHEEPHQLVDVSAEPIGRGEIRLVRPAVEQGELEFRVTDQDGSRKRLFRAEVVVIKGALRHPDASRIASTVVPWKPRS